MSPSQPTPVLDPLLQDMEQTPTIQTLSEEDTTALATPTPLQKKIKADNKTKLENPKKKNPNWNIEEDKLLCSAWLNTTRDSIVGTGQKSTTFWARIHQFYCDLVDDYNKGMKNSKNFKLLPPRLSNAVECRWGHILKTCNKFGGCYSQVERRLKSGRSRDDILAEAKELFKATNESTFNLDHCWAILKDKPKWQSTQQEYELRSKKPPKEKKSAFSSLPPTDDTQPSSPQAEVIECNDEAGKRLVLGNEARPEGNKTAKRKRNEDELLEKVLKTQEELIKISKDRAESVKSAMQVASDERTMA